MKIRRNRLRHSTLRLNEAALAEVTEDDRVYIRRGVVVKDGPSHFEVVEGGADVLVDVLLVPSEELVQARLGGGPVWAIPPVGREVVVAIPDGELEAGPVIIGCESTGEVPDGVGETTVVVVAPAGGQVLVHDGTAADAAELAKLAALEDLKTAITNWVPVAGDGGAALKTALMTLFTGPPAWPSGTSVLKAK